MNKTELLMPAGSVEAFIQAVHNGADAIYLGMKEFSARSSANNFSKEEYLWAIEYAHIHNVSVYVAINTLIDDERFEKAIELIAFLSNNDVDAIIIQDIGLLEVVSKMFVNLEIHASTQMFVHNVQGIEFLKQFNVKRVVLARETPIEVIKECVGAGLEVEVFIYGALCTSYSGQCLMSSVIKNRSGNKGSCAQLCRLPYTLINEDTDEKFNPNQYLLSLKDLNVINELKTLIDIGVKSLKVEGRMKRSEYVGYVCKTIKKAIVAYENNQDFKLNIIEEVGLKKLYNREFTKGFMFNDLKIFNHYRPNHLGIKIGNVVKINKPYITIKLEHDLNQFDGLRIVSKNKDYGIVCNMIYQNNLLVNNVLKGDYCELKVDFPVNVNDEVLLTSDHLQLETIKKDIDNFNNPIKIDVRVNVHVGKQLKCTINDGYRTIIVLGDEIVSNALKRPISNQEIRDKLTSKEYNGLEFNINVINAEDVFISLKELKNIRRNIVETIISVRRKRHFDHEIVPYYFDELALKYTETNVVEINNAKQIKGFDNVIYCSPHKYLCDDNINYLPPLINETNEGNESIIANSFADINENTKITSFNFNITNAYGIYLLHKLGIETVFLSLELNEYEILKIIEHFKDIYGFNPNVGVYRYGYRTLMNTKYCVISACLKTNKGCGLCQKNQFSLEQNNIKYPLFMQNDCMLNILEEKPFKLSHNIEGVNNYYYRYTIEN